ncbi:hypothetical protein JCM11641_008333 [Rhodosporidiobolus odoratus]
MSWNTEAVAAAESLTLASFTSQTAWELGSLIRSTIQALPAGKQRPAIIAITSASGQELFFATSREGTRIDNAHWAARKRASVLRWGQSTASLNVKYGNNGVPAVFGAKLEDYACHGGGFPIRIKGVEPLVAVVVVSGLAQEDDHQVIVDSIEEYIKQGEGKK